MREILKMIVVLALVTGVSGLLLAGVNEGTREQRKKQILKYVKGPAVQEVLRGCSNNPLEDFRELSLGPAEEEGKTDAGAVDLFPGFKDGKLWAVAIESSGGGFGGDIGVVVGIDVETNELLGIGVTTNKETPGLGARVTESGFRKNFKGIPLDEPAKVVADGGRVDAISGATVSSRGVCVAVNNAVAFYQKNKDKILSAVEAK
jgi:Na+-translocating ferredoxin:NAD+ oxidoreductase subunit G